MPTTPKFDPTFWYSGFDGQLFAELLPAQLNYWFVNILGGKYFVTSEISIPETKILPLFQSYKFKFDRATWQYEKSNSFTQNPFLISASSQQVIALCQLGIQSLPQSLKTSSIKVIQKNLHPTHSAYTFFIVTEDYQHVKIGFSRNPSSRLAELQVSRPQTLLYLGCFTSTYDRFEDFCLRFEHLLVRNGWYKFTNEIQKYVEKILSQK